MKKKSDSKQATKDDFQKLEKRMDSKLDGLEKRMDSKFDGLEKRMDSKFDKLMNTLDGFVGRVDDLTTENVIGANQVKDHEKRISKLESRVQSA